jgi:hypothetical protein
MLHIHGTVHVCPRPNFLAECRSPFWLSSSMLHAYVNAACPCWCSISMVHVHVHVGCPCPCPCCLSIFMLPVHVHAAFPCQYCLSMSMLYGDVSAACPCSCWMSMSMLHVQVQASCCWPMLHVFTTFPCCILMLRAYVACPHCLNSCWMSIMVHEHVAWTCYMNTNPQLTFLFFGFCFLLLLHFVSHGFLSLCFFCASFCLVTFCFKSEIGCFDLK